MVKEWRQGGKENVGRNFCPSCKICPHISLFTSVPLRGMIALLFLDVLPVSRSLRWTKQSFKAAHWLTYEVTTKTKKHNRGDTVRDVQ